MQEMDISKEYIKSLVSEKPVILDIGCFDGKDSAELAALFDECEIYCFEADPRNIEKFKQRNGNNPKLHLQPFAIGSVNGKVEFHQSEGKGASGSLKKPAYHLELFPEVKFESVVEVDCTTLNKWYVHNLYPKTIDFIWCDVNGGEEDVIMYGTKALKNTKYLFVEFSDKELYEGQVNKKDLLWYIPDFRELGTYSYMGNFGNVLLKNKNV